MDGIPKASLIPSFPFQIAGIDYERPFKVKYLKGCGNKTYTGMDLSFYMLTTKAIHFEVITDFTKEFFIATCRD